MGINPSCNLSEGRVGFQNLGDPPFNTEQKTVALSELEAAGIPRGASTFTTREVKVYKPDSEAAQLARSGIYIPEVNKRSETMWITVHEVTAEVYGWLFRRAWYYWSVSTESASFRVPLAVAAQLFAERGKEVRTNGDCGCPPPKRDVGSYDVDTPRGLKALVELLKQEHERREAEREADFQRRWATK